MLLSIIRIHQTQRGTGKIAQNVTPNGDDFYGVSKVLDNRQIGLK